MTIDVSMSVFMTFLGSDVADELHFAAPVVECVQDALDVSGCGVGQDVLILWCDRRRSPAKDGTEDTSPTLSWSQISFIQTNKQTHRYLMSMKYRTLPDLELSWPTRDSKDDGVQKRDGPTERVRCADTRSCSSQSDSSVWIMMQRTWPLLTPGASCDCLTWAQN